MVQCPAPVIAVRSLPNDAAALSGQAHEVDRDAFPCGPADCLVSDRTAAPGHDDRAEAVDAGGIEGFRRIGITYAQGAAPDLEGDAVEREEKERFNGLILAENL